MTARYELRSVAFMPGELEPGILYVAKEFGAAAHLCACGCGAVIRTPLDETEWSLYETDEGPSLEPSIGNWQEQCQSHYWITGGKVIWAPKWNSEEIEIGRRREQQRRSEHYQRLYAERPGVLRQLWRRITSFFRL